MDKKIASVTNQKADSSASLALTIYFRRGRIRIHRSTIRSLCFPTYIRLLMNPQHLKLGVQACDETERRSFLVPEKLFDGNRSFEIASKSLLRMILQYMIAWDGNSTYRIFGSIHPSEKIVLFDLTDYDIISDSASDDESDSRNRIF